MIVFCINTWSSPVRIFYVVLSPKVSKDTIEPKHTGRQKLEVFPLVWNSFCESRLNLSCSALKRDDLDMIKLCKFMTRFNMEWLYVVSHSLKTWLSGKLSSLRFKNLKKKKNTNFFIGSISNFWYWKMRRPEVSRKSHKSTGKCMLQFF